MRNIKDIFKRTGMDAKLSLTIVVYHNYKEARQALESIENYTNPNLKKQVYIVDNSYPISPKETNEKEYFDKFISQHSDISYFYTGVNLGFGQGHNYVMPKLNSMYHAIINPDILLTEDTFSLIINYLEDNNDVGMCIPRIVDEYGKLQMVYREEVTILDMFLRMFCKNLFPKRMAKHTLQDKDFSKPFQVPFGQGCFLVIRTELFKRIGGFDDDFFLYLEDADLCKRVNQISKLMYYPGTNIIHKWEQGSHKNKALFMYHIQSMCHYFKKWGCKLY